MKRNHNGQERTFRDIRRRSIVPVQKGLGGRYQPDGVLRENSQEGEGFVAGRSRHEEIFSIERSVENRRVHAHKPAVLLRQAFSMRLLMTATVLKFEKNGREGVYAGRSLRYETLKPEILVRRFGLNQRGKVHQPPFARNTDGIQHSTYGRHAFEHPPDVLSVPVRIERVRGTS